MAKNLVRSLITMVFIACASVSYGSNANSIMSPFSATYTTTWKKGISFKVEGTQTLTHNNGQWLFVFNASTFLASIKESVSFNIINAQILPNQYYYKSQVLGKKREAKLTFDWQNMRVKNDIKNKPWHMDIKDHTLDKLGVQLQIRQDLKNDISSLNYDIADGGKIKHWSFKRVGSEIIRSELGELETIKVIRTDNQSKDRQSTFYFAPSLDYLLVRMKHKEDGESYLLEIESIN